MQGETKDLFSDSCVLLTGSGYSRIKMDNEHRHWDMHDLSTQIVLGAAG